MAPTGPDVTHIEAWQHALEDLAAGVVARHHLAMLRQARLHAVSEGTVSVTVPNEFTQMQLERNVRDALTAALAQYLKQPVQVTFAVLCVPEGGQHDSIPEVDRAPTNQGARSTGPGTEPNWPYTRSGATHLEQTATEPIPLGERRQLVPQQSGPPWDDPVSGPPRLPDPRSGGSPDQDRYGRPRPADTFPVSTQGRGDGEHKAVPPGQGSLNERYTFESFVIGPSNRFAHAAAQAVAEKPAGAYNPLFVHGDSGLGKTHLLHAIGHYVRRNFGGSRVRYASTEEFTNDFINHVTEGRAEQFRRLYRDVDVLLLDDVQFLENKEGTQEEFFHTFNALHNASKQLVISCDRPPKKLMTLEDRLRTRFEWGLICDVQQPDLETRIAILRRKAAGDRISVPPAVHELIASRVQRNIRELEGALTRVVAFASLNHRDLDVYLAEEVLHGLISPVEQPEITAERIMKETATYFSISVDDLRSASRSRTLTNARQIAMYLCRELTDLSLPKIGQEFGGRDHTTVLHADRRIRATMSEKVTVFNQVTDLTRRIQRSQG